MILSYRNQSIDFQSKSIDWFLYERDIDLKRVRFLAQLLLEHLWITTYVSEHESMFRGDIIMIFTT